MRKNLIGLFIILSFSLCGQPDLSDSLRLSLYTDPVPNSLESLEEIVDVSPTEGRFISNTSTPTLTYYRPPVPKNKAIIICPGGGYRGVAIDKEGFLVARALQKKGYHVFVLKYRSPNDKSNKDKAVAPLQDAQQALRVARDYLPPDIGIGIMGFSAGGHLAATASNFFNYNFIENQAQPTVRPDFSILLYPVITMEDPYTHEGSRTRLLGSDPPPKQIKRFSAHLQVTGQTPRVFLVHASDDRSVPVQNSLMYYEACIQNGVPAEMHLYPAGGHGFGMYNQTTPDKWMDRLLNWLATF
jgi:acetyl esterase/lipase